MTIFCDTGFYFAILFSKDPDHQRAISILQDIAEKKFGNIFTSDYVYDEVMTLVNARMKGKRIDLLDKMSSLLISEEPIAKMIKIEKEWLEEIKNIQKKYSNQKRVLSYTDASNIYLCKKERIQKIVSYDKNFEGIIEMIK
ncbi:MAG: VapC ribonuclease [Candidatus Heimdallarchaeota archaeon LC_3]|nr:MAG: VapC ribonuclease [Candidatus Heimdallarchaeota archaeon LC_3]